MPIIYCLPQKWKTVRERESNLFYIFMSCVGESSNSIYYLYDWDQPGKHPTKPFPWNPSTQLQSTPWAVFMHAAFWAHGLWLVHGFWQICWMQTSPFEQSLFDVQVTKFILKKKKKRNRIYTYR